MGIRKLILKKWEDCIVLAQDKGMYRAVVNAVMNLRVS
jgi:hypothetical protein